MKDAFYERALDELTNRNVHKASFARAIEASGGNEATARSLYIKYRVHDLEREATRQREEEKEAKQQRHRSAIEALRARGQDISGFSKDQQDEIVAAYLRNLEVDSLISKFKQQKLGNDIPDLRTAVGIIFIVGFLLILGAVLMR